MASNHDTQEIQPLAPPKRKATDAGLPGTNGRPHKSVKRRASKACQCCRARKVRCNVVEQTPCTNCRLDEVECIVSESKRKKCVDDEHDRLRGTSLTRLCRKWTKPGDEDHVDSQSASVPRDNGSVHSPSSAIGIGQPAVSFQDSPGHHVPHTLCKDRQTHTTAELKANNV